MAKLIRIQKRVWVVIVSLLLTMVHRAAGLISPVYSTVDRTGSRTATVLLLRVGASLAPPANRPAQYYAAELSSSFPFLHVQKVLGAPLSVSGDAVPREENLLALSTVSLDDPQSDEAVLYGPAQDTALPPFTNCSSCASCTDCSSCTDCTNCC